MEKKKCRVLLTDEQLRKIIAKIRRDKKLRRHTTEVI